MAAIYSGGPAAILHKTHTIALLVVDDFYFADTSRTRWPDYTQA